MQYELENYEGLHPGYDEYRFDLDEIGHGPYVLTSILSALHDGVYTLGNRPDPFPNGIYPNAFTVKEPTYYDILPEALEDATFAAMMAKVEKYVGYPYVWSGSSPSTSFDCSSFVSWVINHSGWDDWAHRAFTISVSLFPRNRPRPGDPIFYTNLNSSYWKQHFYCYGRLP